MSLPKVTLEQWRTLQAVIDYGGFAQAAEYLHRSQSSVSYALKRLQELLGLQLLHIQGRKAILTEAGKVLLAQSRQLLADARAIEQQALQLKQGWEPEICLAVEAAFPTQWTMDALKHFTPFANHTRIRLQEVVLSGAEEVLLSGKADLLVSSYVPQGFQGEELAQVHFVAVAHPQHALHQLGRQLTKKDLNRETHVIISDSGSKNIDSGWLNDSRRWTVNSLESARKVITNGMGFGWLPEQEIEQQLVNNELKLLPLQKGARATVILYLIYADSDPIGPATQQLAGILQQVVGNKYQE